MNPIEKRIKLLIIFTNDFLWTARPILGAIGIQLILVVEWLVKWVFIIIYLLILYLALTIQLFYAIILGRYASAMKAAKECGDQIIFRKKPKEKSDSTN